MSQWAREHPEEMAEIAELPAGEREPELGAAAASRVREGGSDGWGSCVTHHACECLGRRSREAVAVAGELRAEAERLEGMPWSEGSVARLRSWADRLEGVTSDG